MGDLGKKMFGSSAMKSWGKIMIGPAQATVAEKVYDNNKKNNAVNFLMPGLATAERVDQGDSLGEALGDPGAFFTQTTPEKKAAAAEAEQERLNATPPTMNTAANSARQQADRLRRRKGVLANIYGGGKSNPGVGTKKLLGS